jgi:DUF4097 and DUF4098 domain-containing protein YvlB
MIVLALVLLVLCCSPRPASSCSAFRASSSPSSAADGSDTRGSQKPVRLNAREKDDIITRMQAQPNADVLEIIKDGGPINVESATNGADLQTGGGNIHVKSAQGFVKAGTGGGNITIDALNGGLEATTGAGQVNVTMVGAPDRQQHEVTICSSKGDITLVVPPGLPMRIDLKLAFTNTPNHYRIVSDFPLMQRTSADWSSAEGTPRKYIYATGNIGAGKALIKIQTVNGNIYLRKGQ